MPEDDDGEVECEFRTPDGCTARGGTVNAATSCDPNPCGGAQSVGDDHHGDDDDQGDDNDDQGENEQCGHHHHGDGGGDDQGEDD